MATSSNPGEGFSAEARDYYYYILADYSVLMGQDMNTKHPIQHKD